MLKIKSLYKKYADGTKAINDINITLNNHGLVYLTGASGSGKSTLLSLLIGLSKPTSGEILFDGVNINKKKNFLMDDISFIAKEHSLISFLSVKENLQINKKIKNLEDNFILKKLGINELLNKNIADLSGGEIKRVEIATALFNKKKIIILDEPLNSLDENNSKIIMELLYDISKDRLVIISGHNKQLISKYADRIIELDDGKIKSDVVINRNENIERYTNNKKYPVINNFVFIYELFKNKFKKNIIYILLFILLNSILLLSIDFKINKNEIDVHALLKYNVNRVYIYSVLNNENVDDNFTTSKIYYKNNMPLKLEDERVQSNYLFYEGLNMNLTFSVINDNTFILTDDIVGDLPRAQNEILLTEYYLNCLIDLNIINNNLDDVIGEYLEIEDYTFKIVGYLKQDLDDFDFLKYITITRNTQEEVFYELFHDGISTKNTIYVSSLFEDYIDYDKAEIQNYIYVSNNYQDLLLVKNLYNNLDYYTEDMFSVFIDDFDNIINTIDKISTVILIITIIALMLINIDYINHILAEYKDDFNNLFYRGYSTKIITKLILYFMLSINFSALLISIIFNKLIVNEFNQVISNVICLNIDIICIENKKVFILICILIILLYFITLIESLYLHRKFKNNFM